jgi:hypothetical protein
MVLFGNRLDAGRQLSSIVKLDPGDNDPIVLGIPRDGIETGNRFYRGSRPFTELKSRCVIINERTAYV